MPLSLGTKLWRRKRKERKQDNTSVLYHAGTITECQRVGSMLDSPGIWMGVEKSTSTPDGSDVSCGWYTRHEVEDLNNHSVHSVVFYEDSIYSPSKSVRLQTSHKETTKGSHPPSIGYKTDSAPFMPPVDPRYSQDQVKLSPSTPGTDISFKTLTISNSQSPFLKDHVSKRLFDNCYIADEDFLNAGSETMIYSYETSSCSIDRTTQTPTDFELSSAASKQTIEDLCKDSTAHQQLVIQIAHTVSDMCGTDQAHPDKSHEAVDCYSAGDACKVGDTSSNGKYFAPRSILSTDIVNKERCPEVDLTTLCKSQAISNPTGTCPNHLMLTKKLREDFLSTNSKTKSHDLDLPVIYSNKRRMTCPNEDTKADDELVSSREISKSVKLDDPKVCEFSSTLSEGIKEALSIYEMKMTTKPLGTCYNKFGYTSTKGSAINVCSNISSEREMFMSTGEQLFHEYSTLRNVQTIPKEDLESKHSSKTRRKPGFSNIEAKLAQEKENLYKTFDFKFPIERQNIVPQVESNHSHKRSHLRKTLNVVKDTCLYKNKPPKSLRRHSPPASTYRRKSHQKEFYPLPEKHIYENLPDLMFPCKLSSPTFVTQNRFDRKTLSNGLKVDPLLPNSSPVRDERFNTNSGGSAQAALTKAKQSPRRYGRRIVTKTYSSTVDIHNQGRPMPVKSHIRLFKENETKRSRRGRSVMSARSAALKPPGRRSKEHKENPPRQNISSNMSQIKIDQNPDDVPSMNEVMDTNESFQLDRVTERSKRLNREREAIILFDFPTGTHTETKFTRGEVVQVLGTWYDGQVRIRRLGNQSKEDVVSRRCLFFINGEVSISTAHGNWEKKCQPKTRKGLENIDNASRVEEWRGQSMAIIEPYIVVRPVVGTCADECTVLRGEVIIVNSAQQREEDWIWVYVPRTQSFGYLPVFAARPLKFQPEQLAGP